MLKAGIGAVQKWVTPGALTDPDVFLYAAKVSVWGRWFIWLVGVFLLAYRPSFWYPEDIEYLSIPVLLGMLNGLVHHRLLTNRPVTWRWMLFLSATEIALITGHRHRRRIHLPGLLSVPRSLSNSFIFLVYYPALAAFAVFAVVFSSLWLSLAWTTTVAVAYVLAHFSRPKCTVFITPHFMRLLSRHSRRCTIGQRPDEGHFIRQGRTKPVPALRRPLRSWVLHQPQLVELARLPGAAQVVDVLA